jgi:hypothetical protein
MYIMVHCHPAHRWFSGYLQELNPTLYWLAGHTRVSQVNPTVRSLRRCTTSIAAHTQFPY